ncbi:MAG: DNA alkylation repair protein [Candidatus Wolfebacteria bacterium]|nr:DNA alkylation repair protein [Candidatus Wolfebacteria bacterium]
MHSLTLKNLKTELKKFASPQKAEILARFFKIGKGEYGEGDIFIGVVVPDIRKTAKKYNAIGLRETEKLLHSKIHEERLCALLILVEKFRNGGEKTKEQIYKLYLKNTKYINNWDLVDLSSHHIVGEFSSDKPTDKLIKKPKSVLYKLAKSKNLWERRIATLATFNFINKGQHKETLKIAEILLKDKHDLIHKAVGWMLRETGKRCSREILEDFLKKHYKQMPRTILRYAIEKFPEKKRKSYLGGKI